jgi:hypothetical protein
MNKHVRKGYDTTTTTQTKQPDNVDEGNFIALTDRKISQATATEVWSKAVQDLKR